MRKPKRENIERGIYILLIIIIVLFGILKESPTAEGLLRALKEAFSILIP